MKKFSEYVGESININLSDILNKNGFKGNLKDGNGEVNYHGIKIKIESGNENLYIQLPEIRTKGGEKETIEALKKFLDEIRNW